MTWNIQDHGFTILPNAISVGRLKSVLESLGQVEGAGIRGVLREPTVENLAHSAFLLDLVRPHLPAEPFPVRAIYFDKSASSNWLVPWHQDLTLALRHRSEVPGFGPWSLKDRVPHVQPPVHFLERMITVRLHLDDADESNGALEFFRRLT